VNLPDFAYSSPEESEATPIPNGGPPISRNQGQVADSRGSVENNSLHSSAGHVVTGFEHGTKTPELTNVPLETIQLQPTTRIAYHTEPQSASADRFRLLRMRLREIQSAKKIRSILITSPLPHDGKSTMALNLATVLAERGRRAVLVVEGDLHRPTLTQQLGLKHGPGLAECLVNQSDPMSAIRRIEPLGWYFLPAGTSLQNSTELLQTEALPCLLKQLSSVFEWILIDSPPVVPLADTLSLANSADASLLVAKAGYTPRRAVDEAIMLLGKQRVLGIILNGVEGLDRYYSGYGYYYRDLA
jgi:capsular exopolysaccharide synthesis family protein